MLDSNAVIILEELCKVSSKICLGMGFKLQEGKKLKSNNDSFSFYIPLIFKKFTIGYFDCRSSLFFLRWGLSR